MSVNVVTVSSTEVRHLIQRFIEAGIMPADQFISTGLPGVSLRASKTLARAIGPRDGKAARVGHLLDWSDEDLLTLPGIAARTLTTIREGLLVTLLERERRGDEGVSWEEIGPRHTTPLTGELTDVSNPCREGRHYRCSGKIALQQLRHGKRYTRCKCPYCNHPKIRTMPLKD